MRGTAAKDFRRQANKVANQTLEVARPAIEAALRNEQVTRGRVEKLEKDVSVMDILISQCASLERFRRRNLRERLRWLLLGR